MVFFYESDFTITEKIQDAQGVALDHSTMDFDIVYSTNGYRTYTASKHGSTYTNCVLDADDHSVLRITLDAHGLQPGFLVREITFHTAPPQGFDGNIQDISKKQYVVDIDTGRVVLGRKTSPAGAGQVYEIYHVDFIKGDSAYQVAVANGFNGTEEEWLVSLAMMFNPRGAYDAETTYAKWDMVNSSDSSYVSIADNNTGNELSDTTKWMPLASGAAASVFAEAAFEAELQRQRAETARAAEEQRREEREAVRDDNEYNPTTGRVAREAARAAEEQRREEREAVRDDNEYNPTTGRVAREAARAVAEQRRVEADNERKIEWGGSESGLKKEILDSIAAANEAAENAGALQASLEGGIVIPAMAEDLSSPGDRVTVRDKFIVRTTAGDESIDSTKDALLLEVVGGCGSLENEAYKINALRWNRANAIDPSAWASGKTGGYITGAVSGGVITDGSNKLCIVHTPKCEAGEYGTAEKNNGWLLTDRNGNNLKVGDGTVVGVWYCAALPASGSAVTAVTEHTFTGHTERFYLPDEGWMVVELASGATLADICCHLAWSYGYDQFTAYAAPAELSLAVSALTSKFQTATVNGKTCLVMRGIEQGVGGIFDRVTIYPEGGGTYERNIAAQLLTDLTWTETEIEGEVVEGEGAAASGYRYTASLPTSGTYAALRDGLIRPDVDGMTLNGYKLTYDSPEQIDPATAFAGKYVDYQIATPVAGTHSINPTGKLPNDMGTEEVIGGDNATGTIVISYMRGFRDTMRALYNDFNRASAELKEMGYTKPLYCVGEWLANANTASPADQDNPDALAVFGNREWALDWRPFLVDMTAVEGETKKHPVMELRKNNWLRDIYGNWAPVVGITTAMRDECMANALYTDADCTSQYCAAGEYDPEAFLALCRIELVNGMKVLTHPTLYKSAATEVGHYLMPWETVETKYSIFVGRKDEVYLLDNVVGASGKEWNGIIGANANVWDGVDARTYALKPTGICPSPATAISENDVVKIRSFFYNYPSSLTGVKGRTGLAGTMFYGDGHYPTSGYSQITTKTNARANNYVATEPFPVAEGGWHARNTFLRCIETALGTKNLCSSARYSSGISAVDACGNEEQWLARGGVRIKATGDTNWTYKGWGNEGKIYYKDGSSYKTTNMANLLTQYAPHSKTLEAQVAVSFAVEFGVAAGEHYIFNGCEWWYANPTTSIFTPPTVADGYMNARVFKVVTGSVSAYSDTAGTPETFTVECCLRTGLALGCDMSGDIGPYWGGGCEIVGECVTTPASGSYGYTLKVYIEPDQMKWVNEGNTNANIGTKFPSGFEDKYRYVGSVVTRTNGYIRRRLPNTPLPASQGATYSKGECGYGYMANYWGSAGKKTRVGVRSGNSATDGYLSARFLNAYYSAGASVSCYCGSAQVLLDVN